MPSSPQPHRSNHKPKLRQKLRGYATGKRADPFYKRTAWRTLRAKFLAEHPTCAECERQGIVTAATEVHHVIARKDRPDLELSDSNLEALCKPCHSRHTLREFNKRRRPNC